MKKEAIKMRDNGTYVVTEMNRIWEPEKLVREGVDMDHVTELANSMSKHGLLEPIVITPDDENQFIILAGHHRFLAAKHLGWEKIPAIVREREPESPALAISAVENMVRKQMSIQEECAAIAYLMEHDKMSPNQISGLLGKSRQWVDRRITAPNLPEKVRAALFEGLIGIAVAEEIAKVEHDGARNSILAEAIYSRRTVSQIRELAAMWETNPNIDEAIKAADEVRAERQTPKAHEANCSLCGTSRPVLEIRAILVCANDCPVQTAIAEAKQQCH